MIRNKQLWCLKQTNWEFHSSKGYSTSYSPKSIIHSFSDGNFLCNLRIKIESLVLLSIIIAAHTNLINKPALCLGTQGLHSGSLPRINEIKQFKRTLSPTTRNRELWDLNSHYSNSKNETKSTVQSYPNHKIDQKSKQIPTTPQHYKSHNKISCQITLIQLKTQSTKQTRIPKIHQNHRKQQKKKKNKQTHQIAIAAIEIQTLNGHHFIERKIDRSVHRRARAVTDLFEELVIARIRTVGFVRSPRPGHSAHTTAVNHQNAIGKPPASSDTPSESFREAAVERSVDCHSKR